MDRRETRIRGEKLLLGVLLTWGGHG
uniref:Uncharacterized protein n=1 Tax=Arundo donax TaxID=35708 RepID=A0A0A8YJR4_ARUDO